MLKPVSVLRVFLCLFTLGSCVSSSVLEPQGLRASYVGNQFARHLFLPAMLQVNPAKKSSVDKTVVENDAVLGALEKRIGDGFKNQSAVVGMSPTALRAYFSAQPDVLNMPGSVLVDVGEKLGKSLASTRELVSSECSNRKSYTDFFVHCVSTGITWRDSLVQLSSKAFNADAALVAVITHVGKGARQRSYAIWADVTVLLVDMNNGQLVWSREASDALLAPPDAVRFPDWDALFSKMFNESFWKDFPGRSTRN